MKITTDKQYAAFRPELLELISPHSRKILDVGCADGQLGLALRTRFGAEVWGVEISPTMAETARQRMDTVLSGPIEEMLPLLPDDYFDAVILADVLEHLADPYTILFELKKKANDNGSFIASLPNVGHWSIIKNLLNGSWRYKDYGLMDSSHLRWFTRETIYDLFGEAGLFIKDMAVTVVECEKIPQLFLDACAKIGINNVRLRDESRVFQYLIKAVDLNRINELAVCIESAVKLIENRNYSVARPFLQRCLNIFKSNGTNAADLVYQKLTKLNQLVCRQMHRPKLPQT